MYQSLLEGKTDCPISGVFGAGKTLSAAAVIAGLLVMDPSLTIMIVTKENVAAHAFVKHFLRLGLPDSINCLVGRLVGYVEMKKGPANQTALDIPPAFRNDVLRSKRVLVGCGGGFHQECQQPYSPVASWMEEADVALNDEGQQYGNLDEASAIARVPRKCLVVWCGDHKQTPGGLRKTDEAKAFRRKLLRRPIALRGDTKHFQPNMLGKVVLRYLDGMDEPLINRVQAILRATMGGRSVSSEEDIVTLQLLCQEVGCPYHEELRSTACSVCTGSALDGPCTKRSFLCWLPHYKPRQECRDPFFFFLVSRTRHHSCAGHCSTIRSLCNFIQNATIPPGRNTQQKNTKPTATKQKTNNATPTTPKPKTKHLSGNRVANFCTTYN